MKRGRYLQFFPLLLSLFLGLLIHLSFAQSEPVQFAKGRANAKKDPASILLAIHTEVKELGFYENEDFLRREFHMNLDGNDTNKEEYVMVFCQRIGEVEKLIVQVTYFEPQKDNRFIKHAVLTREIKCDLKGADIEIRSSDYAEKEVRSVLSDILSGIRSKKKLLKLVKKDGA